MSWIIRSSPVWSSLESNILPFRGPFPVQILTWPSKVSNSLVRVVVIQCSMMQWWVGKKRYDCWDRRLEEKCRGWIEVKEPGAEMRAQAKQKKGAVRRKEERCNRNERALLLLIIGVVMCQTVWEVLHLRVLYHRGPDTETTLQPSCVHWPVSSSGWSSKRRREQSRILERKIDFSALFCPFSARHFHL